MKTYTKESRSIQLSRPRRQCNYTYQYQFMHVPNTNYISK